MANEKEIQYMRIALGLQKIVVNEKTADQIIQTYKAVITKGGKFSVNDAADIEHKIVEKYKGQE